MRVQFQFDKVLKNVLVSYLLQYLFIFVSENALRLEQTFSSVVPIIIFVAASKMCYVNINFSENWT